MTDSLRRSISAGKDSFQQELNLQLLDSSDDCIKVLDLEGRILFMSGGGQASLGIEDVTPFLNTSWVEFWQGADRQAAIEAIAKARAGDICTFQGYCPTVSGNPKWWDSKISPIRGADGQVEQLLCISRDVTDRVRINEKRQQTEEKLRASEEQFRLFVTASSDLVYKMSADWSEMRQLEGKNFLVSTRHPSGTWLEQYIPQEDQSRVMAAIQEAIRTKSTFELEHRVIRLDGTVGWTFSRAIPLLDAQNEIIEWFGAASDVTARKHAEEVIQHSEAKYRSLFDSMDEGFCLIEVLFDDAGNALDYRFLEVNPAFEKHTGLVDADGKTARELVPQLDDQWFKIYGEIALTGVPARFENFAEEMGRWFDVNAFRIGKPDDRTVAILFSDITNRKQAEETLQQTHQASRHQAEQLEQANETLQNTLEELQVTEEELRQHNEELAIARQLAVLEGNRYQDLFNFAPDGYVVTDAKGIIQEANQAIATLVSIDQPYLVNTPLAVYISKPDRRSFRNLLYELLHSEIQKLHTDKLSLSHSEGHPIPVVITGTVIRNAQARIVGLRWLIQDITERKRVELEREHLLARERHYAKQLQGLTIAALAINSALSVEEVLNVITHQAASIIGAHQSVTSMTIDQNWAHATNAMYLSDKYAQWRGFDEKPDGSGIYAYVCHLNRPMRMTQAELEAHPHWKGFSNAAGKHPSMRGWLAAPLVARDGQNIGLIQLSDKYKGEFTEADESILVQLAQMASVAIENARLYEAEQQARSTAETAREEALAANRVKDEFLAVLSHELRSPLNPILGWSKLLQGGKLDETKTAQALATIERNAKLQSELIEDLLDVSRILRGKLSLNTVPVNLASIIRAAMETVRLAADAKSIQVEASLAPDVGLALGDATRLQQVVWNLLSNAVKFTSAGGQVNVRLERSGTHALITVSDTGQGIAPDFLPYVFDYFRQADGATTRKFGGLGLGLAIVRHLVELHGGVVDVESLGVEMGATFTVRLPLMSTQAATSQNEQSSETASDLNGLRVLVVDDEPDSREFVAFVLEQAGAEVMTAPTADEALATLDRFKPNVLLSDIGMPDVDGYMLIQQVRALAPEQGGQIPAIALTAYAGDFNHQQALAVGFQRHLAKPIEPDTLVATIMALLA